MRLVFMLQFTKQLVIFSRNFVGIRTILLRNNSGVCLYWTNVNCIEVYCRIPRTHNSFNFLSSINVRKVSWRLYVDDECSKLDFSTPISPYMANFRHASVSRCCLTNDYPISNVQPATNFTHVSSSAVRSVTLRQEHCMVGWYRHTEMFQMTSILYIYCTYRDLPIDLGRLEIQQQ